MSDLVYKRDNCRLCGSRDLEVVLRLKPSALADAYIPATELDKPQPVYPLDLSMCRSCGFSQLLDVVQPQVIYVNYIYETVSSLGLVDHFANYAKEVLGCIRPQQGALVIDIGSNDGTLLASFKQAGMRVLGIDPAKEIARRATAAGIETLTEFFTVDFARRLRDERGPAAVITANNVLANIDDLENVIQGVRHMLAPDGVLVFESFYLADLIENMVFDFIYHEHISCFAVKPLRQFFRRMGMELIDVLRVPTKGGSIRYTVQLAGGPRPVNPEVARLIAREEKLGIYGPGAFRLFSGKIDKAKEELLCMLRELKSKGKRLAGYGASATTTTLMHHFELAPFMDFIADDYRAKQNLYCPGSHIPVLPPEAIREHRPEYVLILAWRYWNPIVKKTQFFKEQGGQFLVPLPFLRVI